MSRSTKGAKRKIFWMLSIAGTIIAGGALLWGLFIGITLSLDESTVQNLFDSKLPKEVKNTAIHEIKISFQDGIGATVLFSGVVANYNFTVQAKAVCDVEYRPSNNSFYATPKVVKIESLTHDGPSTTDVVRQKADRYITNEGLRNLVKDIAPKADTLLVPVAVEAAKMIIGNFPVHTLNDDAVGFFAIVFLDSVSAHDGKLIVKFTLMRLTWFVLVVVMIFFASLGFIVALIRNPGLGVSASVLSSLGD